MAKRDDETEREHQAEVTIVAALACLHSSDTDTAVSILEDYIREWVPVQSEEAIEFARQGSPVHIEEVERTHVQVHTFSLPDGGVGSVAEVLPGPNPELTPVLPEQVMQTARLYGGATVEIQPSWTADEIRRAQLTPAISTGEILKRAKRFREETQASCGHNWDKRVRWRGVLLKVCMKCGALCPDEGEQEDD